MTFLTAKELTARADARGLRRALIVTALQMEMDAVRAHLTHVGSCVDRVGNVYEVGEFSGPSADWLVIVAESGAGTHTAQNVVTYAHNEFEHFDLMLFSGVAGSRKADIPIGSVVVSSLIYYPYGGKYDNEKGFSSRPREMNIDNRLAGLAKKVKRDGIWPDRIRDPLNAKLATGEVYPQPYPPGSVIGPVASIESVSADEKSELEALLTKYYGDAQAVEMEGYGAVFAASQERTPSIMVRGISDMRGGKDPALDAVYQPIAAAHAAAFGFELIALWGQIHPPEPRRIPFTPTITSAASHPGPPTQTPEQADVTPKSSKAPEADAQAAKGFGRYLQSASAPLLAWPTTLPNGTAIVRPELATLVGRLESSQSTATVLLGEPGAGKSALLASLGKYLTSNGAFVLGIKADLLEPGIQDENGLMRHLGLPDLPSSIIKTLARVSPVYVLIDQLDALAGYVDLRTGRLSVLLNLIRQIANIDNVHVIASARTFEFNHDVRLRSIDAESQTLELPGWHIVLEILESANIDAAAWPPDAKEVLRAPQALATYLRLSNNANRPPFESYQAMLEELWRDRILTEPDGRVLSDLASAIAQQMAEIETLWLATARYDSQIDEINKLVGNGILTYASGEHASIGFTHQTLFGHALARGFVKGTSRLSEFVLSRQASLFIRPKLWSALTYLRGVEPATYERELSKIWNSKTLRLHLRILLIEFIGQQVEARPIEITLLGSAFQQSDFRLVSLRSIAGSKGWFGQFATSFIAEAMTRDDLSAQSSTFVLERAWSFAPEQVSKLVLERWGNRAGFDGPLWSFLQSVTGWNTTLIDLAKTVLERTDIAPYAFDHVVATIGLEQPQIAIDLVAAKLGALLVNAEVESAAVEEAGNTEKNGDFLGAYLRSSASSITKIFDRDDGWESLEALAKSAPVPFLEAVWPLFEKALDILRALEPGAGLGFPIPYKLDLRLAEEDELGLPEHAVLGALRVALEETARQDQKKLFEWIDAHKAIDASPAQRLIAHALTVMPEQSAEVALDFLIEDTRRFSLGSLQDQSSTTKRLIKSASAFWSDSQVERFIESVNAYSPEQKYERDGAKGRQTFQDAIRHLRYHLLASIAPDRTPDRTRQLIQEERRRYAAYDDRPRSFGSSFIGSSMSASQFSKASDEEILNAFRKLPDATEWDHPKNWHVGGNIQLAREFAAFARNEPERAAVIIRQFTPETGTRASSLAIESMAESADPLLIQNLIVFLDGASFNSQEFRRTIAWGVERLVRRGVSIEESIVKLLISWLSNAEPAVAEPNDDADAEASETIDSSVLWSPGGISSVPGGSFPFLEALARILLTTKDHERLLEIVRDHLKKAEPQRVWQSFLHLLRYLKLEDAGALSKFYVELFDKYPSMLSTVEGIHFLAHVQWTAPDFVQATIPRLRETETELAQQGFGELSALMSIVNEGIPLAKSLTADIAANKHGVTPMVGAAYAAVNLWREGDFVTQAYELFCSLVPFATPKVWSAIFDIFRMVDETTPSAEMLGLLNLIADNMDEIGAVPSSFIVDRLAKTLPLHAEVVGAIALGLTNAWRKELGDMRTGTAAAAPELVDLAITLHRLGPTTRDIGTDIFERLLEVDAYSARQTLEEIDNKFRRSGGQARRRLPRRNASARSRRPRVPKTALTK
jgi:nucleoside phosphorylase